MTKAKAKKPDKFDRMAERIFRGTNALDSAWGPLFFSKIAAALRRVDRGAELRGFKMGAAGTILIKNTDQFLTDMSKSIQNKQWGKK